MGRFRNYQQHKIDISPNYIFPFISFVKFVPITDQFGGKMLINLVINFIY